MSLDELSWIDALNEQTQWKSDFEAQEWLLNTCRLLQAQKSSVSRATETEIELFLRLLTEMRRLVYHLHFEEGNPHSTILSEYVNRLRLSFDTKSSPALKAELNLPEFSKSEYSYIFGTLLLNFANDLSRMLSAKEKLIIHRCEGLFRDNKAERISIVAGVKDSTESLWRNEIPLIVEKALEKAPEIQRCADLFISKSRSKYCSDACRFTTFKIEKQLKDPNYLAEKQRRYRQRKSEDAH